jgi:hypothetical protein
MKLYMKNKIKKLSQIKKIEIKECELNLKD